VKFFDREEKIGKLRAIRRKSVSEAQFTVITGRWSRIGSWWDRKGENEIDLVAENELDGGCVVCEVKRDKSRIDLKALKAKFAAFANAVGGRWKHAKPEFLALSTEDM